VKIILLEPQPDSICIQAGLKHYNLDSRQEEIALFSSQGTFNQQIAEMLFITKYTVKDSFEGNLFKK